MRLWYQAVISRADGWDGPAGGLGGPAAKAVRTSLERRVVEMTAVLGELVTAESSTDDPEGLARVAELLESMLAPYGTIERRPSATDGVDHLLLNVPGEHAQLPPAVVLGHFDTVWARGTIEHIPFRVSDVGVVTGPGCFDMKGGLVLLLFALRELAALGVRPRRPVRIVLNADEEVGSPQLPRTHCRGRGRGRRRARARGPAPGRDLEDSAQGQRQLHRHDHRPGRPLRHRARQGCQRCPRARPSGAGDGCAEPPRPRHDRERRGGQRWVQGERRSGERGGQDPRPQRSAGEADRVRAALQDLRPHLPGAEIDVVAGLAREPMERTPQIGQLFATAAAIAAEMGVGDLREGSTGGASDGNLVAALGIPTLDGLGPEGVALMPITSMSSPPACHDGPRCSPDCSARPDGYDVGWRYRYSDLVWVTDRSPRGDRCQSSCSRY